MANLVRFNYGYFQKAISLRFSRAIVGFCDLLLIIITRLFSAVNTRLSVNRDMVKYYEAYGLLTTPVYVFALSTHVTALLGTGLFITRY